MTDARAELVRSSGTHFDPRYVRAFLDISLGRMRLVVGPLSWLAHAPLLARIPLTPSIGAALGGVAAVVATTATVMAGPTDAPQAAVLRTTRPSRPPAKTAVVQRANRPEVVRTDEAPRKPRRGPGPKRVPEAPATSPVDPASPVPPPSAPNGPDTTPPDEPADPKPAPPALVPPVPPVPPCHQCHQCHLPPVPPVPSPAPSPAPPAPPRSVPSTSQPAAHLRGRRKPERPRGCGSPDGGGMGDGHLCGSGAREFTSGRLHGHDRQSRSVRVPAVGRRRRDTLVQTDRQCVRLRRCVRGRPRRRRYSRRRRRLEQRGHVHDRDPAGQRRANVLDRWEPGRGVASRGAVGVGIRVGDAGAGQRVGAAHDVRRHDGQAEPVRRAADRSRPTEHSPTRLASSRSASPP